MTEMDDGFEEVDPAEVISAETIAVVFDSLDGVDPAGVIEAVITTPEDWWSGIDPATIEILDELGQAIFDHDEAMAGPAPWHSRSPIVCRRPAVQYGW